MTPNTIYLTAIRYLKHLMRAQDTDHQMGKTSLMDLPEPYFLAWVTQHNSKLQYLIHRLPEHSTTFRNRLQGLLILTPRQYHRILDDKDRKKDIHPDDRKQNFSAYKAYILTTEPLTSWYREYIRKPMPTYLPRQHRAKHLFMVCGTGGGKTECHKLMLLTDKIPRSTEPFPLSTLNTQIFMDLHGDGALEISRNRVFLEDYRAHLTQGDHHFNLVYLDPTLGMGEDRYFVINPFELGTSVLTTIQIERTAQNITEALMALLPSGVELSLQMTTCLLPCITLLLHIKGSTFLDLLRLMGDHNHDLLDRAKTLPNPAHRTFFEERFMLATYRRTRESLATKIQALVSSEAFRRTTCGQSTIDLGHAIKSGKTILFALPRGRIGVETASALGKLFVSQILSLVMNRADTPTEYRTPTTLILDEAHLVINPSLQVILSESRKYGLSLTMSTQVISQGMDSGLNRILMGNTFVKGIGIAGTQARETMAKEMGIAPADLLGLKPGEFVWKSGSGPPLRMRMNSTYVGDGHLMNDQEWTELRTAILDRYYRRSSGILLTPDPDHQLVEDISADTEPTAPQSAPNSAYHIDHFDL